MADVIVTQEDREAAAAILDIISGLLDHTGIGQVADLIRDGEYDEHDIMPVLARHRHQAMIEGARVGLEAAVKAAEAADIMPLGNDFFYSGTSAAAAEVEALSPADIIRRHLEGEG